MGPIKTNQAHGHVVELSRSHPGHLNSDGHFAKNVTEDKGNFGHLVARAIGEVSDKQLAADELFERMITHPDEVEPHDVTIAMAQAEMSLNLTKTIVDRALKAYTDITTMR